MGCNGGVGRIFSLNLRVLNRHVFSGPCCTCLRAIFEGRMATSPWTIQGATEPDVR